MQGFDLVVITGVVPLAGLLLLLLMMRINPLFSRKQNALFLSALGVNLFMLLVVAVDFLLSAHTGAGSPWMARRCTTFLNFACAPAVPLLLYKVFDTKKISLAFCLPAVLNMLLCVVSIFYKVVFFIGHDNGYGRGPLFFAPFCVSLFYIGVIFFKPAKHQLQSKRMERLVLMCIIGLLLVSMYLEVIGRLRFLLWSSSAIGLILYYLLLNIHNFILDPLTGAYNRIQYTKDLANLNGAEPCTIALIDINDFKLVNDRLGHEAGDQCLINFTKILNRSFQSCATLYRIGGDEFVLIARGRKQGRFGDCLDLARRQAGKENIRFACGLVAYDGMEEMESALRRVDHSMYEEKSGMKKD